jgi:hypothetical protein
MHVTEEGRAESARHPRAVARNGKMDRAGSGDSAGFELIRRILCIAARARGRRIVNTRRFLTLICDPIAVATRATTRAD